MCVICTTKWSYFDRDYSLGSAPGILLKARRQRWASDKELGLASLHQVGELGREFEEADLDREEQEASDNLWYEAAAGKREALAEEVRADAGETKFSIANSLRVSWLVAQRADPSLYALLANPDEKKGSFGIRWFVGKRSYCQGPTNGVGASSSARKCDHAP